MQIRIRTLFKYLIVLYLLHGIDEYLFRFYEPFPPANWIDSVLPGSSRTGLIAITTILVMFGIRTYFSIWKVKSSSSRVLLWIWVAFGVYNGIAHIIWGMIIRGYYPGLLSGILL